MLLVFSFACNHQNTQNYEAEEKKIWEVIRRHTQHFLAQDIEGIKDAYAPYDYTYVQRDYYGVPGSVLAGSGYDNIVKGYETYFKNPPQTEYISGEKENLNIEIRGNVAWVTFKNIRDQPRYEVRILEKINGQWKISLLAIHIESEEMPVSFGN